MARISKGKPNPFGNMIQESGQARAAQTKAVQVAGEQGRDPGRRSRAGFTQVAGYVPADLYREVKKKLLDEDQNFSELLESWMRAYTNNRLAS